MNAQYEFVADVDGRLFVQMPEEAFSKIVERTGCSLLKIQLNTQVGQAIFDVLNKEASKLPALGVLSFEVFVGGKGKFDGKITMQAISLIVIEAQVSRFMQKKPDTFNVLLVGLRAGDEFGKTKGNRPEIPDRSEYGE